jgi:hypothetical protein
MVQLRQSTIISNSLQMWYECWYYPSAGYGQSSSYWTKESCKCLSVDNKGYPGREDYEVCQHNLNYMYSFLMIASNQTLLLLLEC